MAPLSNEIRPITSCLPPHLGPAVPEVRLHAWNFNIYVFPCVSRSFLLRLVRYGLSCLFIT